MLIVLLLVPTTAAIVWGYGEHQPTPKPTDRPLGFERGAVGQIGFEQTFLLQVLKCIRRLGQQPGSPAQQLLSKIFDLKGIHEFFIVGRMITWR